MAARTYRFRTERTTSGDSVATITLQRNGRIRSVAWSILAKTSVANTTSSWELSTNNGSGLGTHDPAGVISTAAFGQILQAGATGHGVVNKCDPIDYAVKVGDRINLHARFENGNETTVCMASMVVEESS